ncbi:MAG: UvrB/UvrC motif-containing protein [Clostridia bacterium]|nr:UvrB/UvrC motif-containing protein [Clostridia bacterium]
MLCEKCKKNNAAFFFEENINGKKRSFALCSSCAEEMKKNGELQSGESLFDSLGFPSSLHDSLFGSLFASPAKAMQIGTKKTCPGCGSTLEDFRRLGKAGCSECYRTFSAELEPTIRSIHGNAKHTGRAPAKEKAKHEKENELKALKIELKSAIENEEFEKAAQLRDKIKSIEGKKRGE